MTWSLVVAYVATLGAVAGVVVAYLLGRSRERLLERLLRFADQHLSERRR